MCLTKGRLHSGWPHIYGNGKESAGSLFGIGIEIGYDI